MEEQLTDWQSTERIFSKIIDAEGPQRSQDDIHLYDQSEFQQFWAKIA